MMATVRKAYSDYLPDFLSLAGFSMLGYGLYMFEPWLSFTICGALLLVAGARMAR
jgi:hypothetical protein